MAQDLGEELTAQFYHWEILGRGWLLSPECIQLEAPFTPFFGHFPWKAPAYVDDGFKHTMFSRIASAIVPKKEPITTSEELKVSYNPYLAEDDEDLVHWQLSLPKGATFSQAQSEQFLSMLSYCTRPISFELIGTAERITIQLTARECDASYVKAQCQTYFPNVTLIQAEDIVAQPSYGGAIATVDYGLEQEFMRPIQANTSLDPHTPLYTVLEHLQQGEKICIQVLFNGTLNKWGNSMMRSVTDYNGKAFFVNAPDMLPLTKQKISKPLLASTIRTIAFANILEDAFDLVRKVTFAFQTLSSSSNGLIPLSNEDYDFTERVLDIEFRTSRRLGMLLNTEELSLLVHLPSPSLQSNKLLTSYKRTKAAPTAAKGHKFILGRNEHQGQEELVSLNQTTRFKHTHILGATGTGKSSLLLSMVTQDIAQGNGLAVLDPHGDLIDAILEHIPKGRIHDVILFDPSDTEHPIGFNILQAYSEIEKETLTSDLVATFKRLSTTWGDQMHSILSNAILAFLESSKGGTLHDLRRFLLEPSFRTHFLSTVTDPDIHYYWDKQYPLIKSGSIGPIVTRLDSFLRSKIIRNMVIQKKGLDFHAILNSQKILLVKLSQGLIGEENSYLLGSFIVSKIHQAALARQAATDRKDFFLYIDEFQHFITPSMAAMLSGTRKYNLGLVLAHQTIQQLNKEGADLSSALLGNVGTRICFRLGEADAKKMAEGFSFFQPRDLQNLTVGEAIARIESPENDFSFCTIPTTQPEVSFKNEIFEHSRKTYGSTAEIEKQNMFQLPTEATATIEEPKQIEPRITTVIEQSIPIDVAEVPAEPIQQKQQTQHRYLQNLIKQFAELKGYKATLEVPTPDGKGRVDVVLEKARTRIACEISVTTDISWELHNLKKCVDAGYKNIIACVIESKQKIKFVSALKDAFESSILDKIQVLELEELFLFLDSQTDTTAQANTVKGYRVKVSYDSISPEASSRKKEAIAKVVLSALKRLKK